MKPYIFSIFFVLIFSSVVFSQQDTIFTIKNTKVEIGKFYVIHYNNGIDETVKVIGVSDKSILVIVKNESKEYKLTDFETISPAIGYIEKKSNRYSSSKKHKSPSIYITAGYVYHPDEGDRGPNEPVETYSGINVQAGLIYKISDYIATDMSLSYLHLFGKTIESTFGVPDGTYYIKWTNNYGDANDVYCKTGISFGYLKSESPVNFYLSMGIIFGFEFADEDIFKEYQYIRNVEYNYQGANDRGSNFRFGVYGNARFSCRLSDKMSIISEAGVNSMGEKTGFFENYSVGVGYQF